MQINVITMMYTVNDLSVSWLQYSLECTCIIVLVARNSYHIACCMGENFCLPGNLLAICPSFLYDNLLKHEQSMNHISLKKAYILCKVAHFAGCISANTRPHRDSPQFAKDYKGGECCLSLCMARQNLLIIVYQTFLWTYMLVLGAKQQTGQLLMAISHVPLLKLQI